MPVINQSLTDCHEASVSLLVLAAAAAARLASSLSVCLSVCLGLCAASSAQSVIALRRPPTAGARPVLTLPRNNYPRCTGRPSIDQPITVSAD